MDRAGISDGFKAGIFFIQVKLGMFGMGGRATCVCESMIPWDAIHVCRNGQGGWNKARSGNQKGLECGRVWDAEGFGKGLE